MGMSVSVVITNVYKMETAAGETDRAGVCKEGLRSDKNIP